MGIDQTEPDADRKYDASADYHLNDGMASLPPKKR